MCSTKSFCRKCAHKKCAENVHTKMCRKCAHKNVQKMRTHKMCRIVHTQICAEMCTPSFVQKCARRICVRVVRRVVFENCVDEKFPVMHIRKFYAREHCPTCVQKVFGDDLRKLSENVHVQNCAQTVTCAKCQKWPKNDQK